MLKFFLDKPMRAVPPLLVLALAIEIGQYWPDAFPGAHAIGEVMRNLAYALIGAIIFSWLIVEIPAGRRRRSTYAFHQETFRTLLTLGLMLLKPYEENAKLLGANLDVRSKDSLDDLATKLDAVAPIFYGKERADTLSQIVDRMVPMAVAALGPSVGFLDLDVAHALSQFPRQDSLTMLQVRRTPTGGVEPFLDVLITWTLLEAARPLYQALLSAGAYDSSIVQGFVGSPGRMVPLASDPLEPA
jgi:hypothetical protein